MKNLKKLLISGSRKHATEIFVGIGIASGITSTIFAVKGTTKAVKLIEEEKRKKEENLTPLEIVKITWPCYILSALSCAMSVTCIISGTSVNLKRNTALITACKLSETALCEYRDKVVENIGKKADNDIRDAIAQDKLNDHPITQSNIVHITTKGESWCFEPLTGRYFESNISDIEKAVITVNNKMITDGYASLNDFFEELGMECSDVGDLLGWDSKNGIFKINYTSRIQRINNDEIPCIVIDYYESPPTYDYDVYY